MRRSVLLAVVILLAVAGLVRVAPAAVADDLPGPALWVPTAVTDDVAWTDTFGDPRGGGRTHKGVDMMAPQMTPVYVAESGWIRRAYGGSSRECLDGGTCNDYGFLIFGDSGWSQFYLHLNDDTPGRPNGCDHAGGAENAFSPRLVDILRERGTLEPLPNSWDPSNVVRVEQGELLGYVGSSGNAGCRTDHLHFELWQGHDFKGANDSTKSNPTPYVDEARSEGRFWGPEGPIVPVPTDRVAGGSRIGTAVALSREAFDSADIAFIAPAEHHVEALVGAPLAAVVAAPMLLAWGTPADDRPVLDDVLVEELQRLGAARIVLIGSTARLDGRLEAAIEERLGIPASDILRFDQPDPWSLSEAVAREMLSQRGWAVSDEPGSEGAATDPATEPEMLGPWLLRELSGQDEQPEPSQRDAQPEQLRPVIALGWHEDPDRAWPDALAAATLAAGELEPVLLVRGNELPDEIVDVLGEEGMGDVRIVGGAAAVSSEVEQEIRDAGHATRRLAGADRVLTALAVAQEIETAGGLTDRVFVATARNFPDALAAGGSVARLGRVLVLVDGLAAEAGPVEDWMRDRVGEVERVTAIGGAGVISDRTLRRLAVSANWPKQQGDPAPKDDGGQG